MESFVLLAYASLEASRKLLNFTLYSEDLFCWYKRKKWFLWTIAAAEAAENYEDEWGLTWYLSNFNQNPLTKFTSSSRSTEFKDILPWDIFHIITMTIPITTRIVISYAMKQGIPLWIWWKVTGNWDSNMIRIFLWRESHCWANTSVRRNK